jgi:hypothetical protein
VPALECARDGLIAVFLARKPCRWSSNVVRKRLERDEQATLQLAGQEAGPLQTRYLYSGAGHHTLQEIGQDGDNNKSARPRLATGRHDFTDSALVFRKRASATVSRHVTLCDKLLISVPLGEALPGLSSRSTPVEEVPYVTRVAAAV